MNDPYAVVTINLLVIVAYLFTFLLARLHFIQMTTHRQLWNVVLLATLFSAGVLGLILAVQVNQKISISSTDRLFIWHVNSGIALFIVALLHVSRHLSYFTNLLLLRKEPVSKNPGKNIEKESQVNDGIAQTNTELLSPKQLKMALIATGISAMVTQLVIIKALLSVFNGNELVIGVLLANWMVLTGLGAFAAKRKNTKLLSGNAINIGVFLLSALPICLLFLLSLFRNIIFIPGSMAGIWEIAGFSFVLLAPFCLWSGYFFIVLSIHLSQAMQNNRNQQAYLLESTGGILGGAVFSFLFVQYFHPFQSLILLALINTALMAYGLSGSGRILSRFLPSFALLCVLFILWMLNIDRIATQLLFPHQELIAQSDTPYSKLVVTRTNDQLNFFADGNLLFASNNTIANEETVHYAMVQHPYPENVLLIGGGISGTIHEILKYPVQSLTYMELDPMMLQMGQKYMPVIRDKRLRILSGDARIFLRQTHQRFDVVIIDQPPPVSMQVNRFYTIEFFKLLKTKLTPESVLSLSLMPTPDYVSDVALQLHAVMLSTLKLVFRNAVVITGDKNYMLASDEPLRTDIANLIQIRNIPTDYVNAYYLDDQLLAERIHAVMKRISVQSVVNHDLQPVAYYLQQNYWLSHFRTSLFIPLIFLLILSFFLLFRMSPVQSGIFISGFSAASMEVMLILTSQVLCGYIYRTTGIIITAFMAGLALGALTAGCKASRCGYSGIISIQFFEGIFILLICLLLVSAEDVTGHPALFQVGIPLLMMILAYLTGLQFGKATYFPSKEPGAGLSGLYSADLAGAALGALLVATLLLPLLGMNSVMLFLAGLNFICGFVMLMRRKWQLMW